MKIQLWTAGMLYYIATFEIDDSLPTVLVWKERAFLISSMNATVYSEVTHSHLGDFDGKFDPLMSAYLPHGDPRRTE